MITILTAIYIIEVIQPEFNRMTSARNVAQSTYFFVIDSTAREQSRKESKEKSNQHAARPAN